MEAGVFDIQTFSDVAAAVADPLRMTHAIHSTVAAYHARVMDMVPQLASIISTPNPPTTLRLAYTLLTGALSQPTFTPEHAAALVGTLGLPPGLDAPTAATAARYTALLACVVPEDAVVASFASVVGTPHAYPLIRDISDVLAGLDRGVSQHLLGPNAQRRQKQARLCQRLVELAASAPAPSPSAPHGSPDAATAAAVCAAATEVILGTPLASPAPVVYSLLPLLGAQSTTVRLAAMRAVSAGLRSGAGGTTAADTAVTARRAVEGVVAAQSTFLSMTGDGMADYEFYKGVGGFLSSIAAAIVGAGVSDTEETASVLVHLAQPALALLAHPSPVVFSELTTFWHQLLRDEPLSRSPQLLDSWKLLLSSLPALAAKRGDPAGFAPSEPPLPGTTPAAADPAVEFTRSDFPGGTEDWRRWLGTARQRLVDMLRDIVVIYPGLALQAAGQALQAAVASLASTVHVGGPAHAAADGGCSTHSPSFIDLDGVLCVVENVIGGMFNNSLGVCGVQAKGAPAGTATAPEWMVVGIRQAAQSRREGISMIQLPLDRSVLPQGPHSVCVVADSEGGVHVAPPTHPTRNPYYPEFKQMIVAIAQILINFRPVQHATLNFRVLQSLGCITGFLARFAHGYTCAGTPADDADARALVVPLASRLLQDVVFTSPVISEETKPLSELCLDTLAVRKKAALTLLTVCMQAPECMSPVFGDIWGHIMTLAESTPPKITEGEHAILIRAALAVTCGSPTLVQNRDPIISTLLRPLTDPLLAATSEVLASPQALVLALDPSHVANQSVWDVRRGVAHSLGGIVAIGQALAETPDTRVLVANLSPSELAAAAQGQCYGADAMQPLLRTLMPSFVALSTCISRIYCDNSIRAELANHPDAATLLTFPEGEVRRLLGAAATGVTGRPGQDVQPGLRGEQEYLRHWLFDRHHSLCELAAVCVQARLGMNELASLVDTIAGVHVISNAPLYLIRNIMRLFVRPMFAQLPIPFVCRVLASVLCRCAAEELAPGPCSYHASVGTEDAALAVTAEAIDARLLSEVSAEAGMLASVLFNATSQAGNQVMPGLPEFIAGVTQYFLQSGVRSGNLVLISQFKSVLPLLPQDSFLALTPLLAKLSVATAIKATDAQVLLAEIIKAMPQQAAQALQPFCTQALDPTVLAEGAGGRSAVTRLLQRLGFDAELVPQGAEGLMELLQPFISHFNGYI